MFHRLLLEHSIMCVLQNMKSYCKWNVLIPNKQWKSKGWEGNPYLILVYLFFQQSTVYAPPAEKKHMCHQYISPPSRGHPLLYSLDGTWTQVSIRTQVICSPVVQLLRTECIQQVQGVPCEEGQDPENHQHGPLFLRRKKERPMK